MSACQPRRSLTLDLRVLRDSDAAQAVLSLKSKWEKIVSSNVVSPHCAFSSQSFGDNSIVIISEFYPDSVTLRERHLPAGGRGMGRASSPLPEQTIWTYLVQMTSALKTIHAHDMAARSMDAQNWLLTDEDHVRFNASGIADIVDPEISPLIELQQADLHNLGKLLFTMATASRPIDHFQRAYSLRLRQTLEWLQQQTITTEAPGTIDDLCGMLAAESLSVMDAALRLDDTLQHHLNRELENGRLVRLLFKLNAINERPEYQNDAQWRDQGQRAALKLFRDYVFHQVDATGNPVLDMGHMLSCLNKLDVGIEEKIMLTTRDGMTVLVVSYREMKTAVESAWAELMRRSSTLL